VRHPGVVEPKLDGTRAASMDLVVVVGASVSRRGERHAFTTVDRGRYGSKFWCGSLPTPGPVRLDASTLRSPSPAPAPPSPSTRCPASGRRPGSNGPASSPRPAVGDEEAGAFFRARAGTRPGRAWQVRCRARRSWCCPHQGRSVEINDMDVSSCSTSSTARRPATRWPRGPEGSTPSPPARTGWTPTRCSSGPTAVSPGPCPPGQDLDATTPVRAPGTWSGQPA
jgi:hypothetical protein